MCYLAEKPLLLTDNASVTPAINFGFPETKIISKDEKDRIIKFTADSLGYGHIVRNNQHFHYHIYDENFINDNKDNIIKWLREKVNNRIRQDELCGLNYKDSDNVLLIAPKHFSNTTFINIVNEILFYDSANILHYDFWNNSIENFKIFYSETLFKADKILFLDDAVITGSTFLRSNDFVKQIRVNLKKNINEKQIQGFDACIFLINRIDGFTQNNIYRKLENKYRFFSYANINLPALEKNSSGKCPLCYDRDKAKSLFDYAYLYRFKHIYYDKIKKLKLEEISTDFESNSKNKSDRLKPYENINQNLIKVELIHRIYEYFKDVNNQENFIKYKNVDDWVSDLLKSTESPFENKFMENNVDNNTYSSNSDIALKVLAHTPFNIYKPIKEKTFEWTVLSLNTQIEFLKNSDFSIYEYLAFRKLKYLIRRVGLIGSNYLISNRFIQFIIKLYTSNWLSNILQHKKYEVDELYTSQKDLNLADNNRGYTLSYSPSIEKAEKEYFSIEENVNEFSTFVISQIKEVLYQNETRSCLLEKNIFQSSFEMGYPIQLQQFIRILRQENGSLIEKFWELYSDYEEQSIFENLNVNQNNIVYKSYTQLAVSGKTDLINKYWKYYEDTNIQSTLEAIYKKNHYQYNDLCDFFSAAHEQMPHNNLIFIDYINIQKSLLLFEMKENNMLLQEKTKQLFDKISRLVFQDVNNCGGFLLVNYKANGKINSLADVFMAYNKGLYSSYVEKGWKTDNYITSFINGVTNTNKLFLITADVLEKKNNKWNSIYFLSDETDITIEFLNDCEDINYVFLLRLSLKEIDGDSEMNIQPQGVLIYYSKTNIFSVTKVRYLLLLKQSICRYINKHHRSDEFRDWVESERRNKDYIDRYSKNTHGVYKSLEKVLNLADDNPDLFAVYSDILLGKIHYSLLVGKKILYETQILPLTDALSEQYFELISSHLINHGFNKYHIHFNTTSFQGVDMYYNEYSKYILYQLINNIISYTIENMRNQSVVTIYVRDDYIIFENSKSKITQKKLDEIIDSLNNNIIPLKSISLYVINRFCKDMCDYPRVVDSISLELYKDDTFVVKLPLIYTL